MYAYLIPFFVLFFSLMLSYIKLRAFLFYMNNKNVFFLFLIFSFGACYLDLILAYCVNESKIPNIFKV